MFIYPQNRFRKLNQENLNFIIMCFLSLYSQDLLDLVDYYEKPTKRSD